MVVDDEPDHRELARGVMERGGHTVLTARDAMQALELLDQHDVELVVTDLYMPRMDGLELAAKLHADHPDVGCIVWSAVGEAQQGEVLPKNVMMMDVDRWIEQHAPEAGRGDRDAR